MIGHHSPNLCNKQILHKLHSFQCDAENQNSYRINILISNLLYYLL